jgi:hypothetical protein
MLLHEILKLRHVATHFKSAPLSVERSESSPKGGRSCLWGKKLSSLHSRLSKFSAPKSESA